MQEDLGMTSRNQRKATPTAEQLKGDLQERTDKAQEQGYFGHVPDKTPNEAYTLGGQAAGMLTPESPENKPASDALEGDADPNAGEGEE